MAQGGTARLGAPTEIHRLDAALCRIRRAAAGLLQEPILDRWGPPLALLVLGLGVIAVRGPLPPGTKLSRPVAVHHRNTDA